MELVDQSARVLQVCHRFPTQLSLSLHAIFLVTQAGSADLFVSVRRELLLPGTHELQGRWLAWVAEVYGTPHQLGASDHVGD